MEDTGSPTTVLERLLPERLQRLRRVTGLPVAFGGTTRDDAVGRPLVLTRLSGTAGTGLRGLIVPPGVGLGGRVLVDSAAQRVDHYASTSAITHDFDDVVVGQEALTAVAAVPVVVRGRVLGVLYGAVRGEHTLGDRAVRLAGIVADQLAQDVEHALRPAPVPATDTAPEALDELARIIAATADPDLRARLAGIHRALAPRRRRGSRVALAPREVDVLRLVAVGATNAEAAARLGLAEETVKAYLRTAMRRLGVTNRTAAVHAARTAGALAHDL